MASQFDLTHLISLYVETAAAVRVQARRTPPNEIVATQEHTLRVDDLLATLAVEATIHHLDMIVHLDASGPAPAALAAVRTTLDGTAWLSHSHVVVGHQLGPRGDRTHAA